MVIIIPNALPHCDSDPLMQPMMHQYVGSKAPWFEITDGVPQFPEAGVELR